MPGAGRCSAYGGDINQRCLQAISWEISLPTPVPNNLLANMRWSAISAAAAALLPLASGAGFTTEEYASGEVMDFMMSAKEEAWAKQRAIGNHDTKKWNGFGKKRKDKDVIKCKNGKAEAVKGDKNQTYSCKDIVSLGQILSAANLRLTTLQGPLRLQDPRRARRCCWRRLW